MALEAATMQKISLFVAYRTSSKPPQLYTLGMVSHRID